MKIGFAGVGRMGSAMVLRLLEKGHTVAIWNRSPNKLAALAAAGAEVKDTPKAVVADSDIVITSLLDGPALTAVYEGADGLLAASMEHKPLFIEMSTVLPAESAALAEKVRATGAAFIECPVGGSTGPARTGNLLGLVGGDEEDAARAMPVLADLCRRVERVGPVGAGASLKLAINLPLLVYYQSLGEAYTLCGHLGLDPQWLVDFFSETSGGINMLKTRGPALAKALGGEDPGPPGFGVDGIRKDLRTMIAAANALGAELPLTAQALAIYDEASKSGLGDADGSTLAGYWPHHARA